MNQDTHTESQTKEQASGAPSGAQSAQADFNKAVEHAKAATEGFELKKLFEGRVGNMPFLYFFVGAIVIGMVAGMIPLINMLVAIAVAVIGVGVGIRRFHDIGVTGWASLVFLVPFLGLAVALYLCWKHGDAESNVYGPVPDPTRPILKAILNS